MHLSGGHLLDSNCIGLSCGEQRGSLVGTVVWQCARVDAVALPGHDGRLGLGWHGVAHFGRNLHPSSLPAGSLYGFCYFGSHERGR